jgi:hypothetical protein
VLIYFAFFKLTFLQLIHFFLTIRTSYLSLLFLTLFSIPLLPFIWEIRHYNLTALRNNLNYLSIIYLIFLSLEIIKISKKKIIHFSDSIKEKRIIFWYLINVVHTWLLKSRAKSH